MPLVAIVLMMLLLPAAAEAKITCEEQRTRAGDVPLWGLPDSPVAGRGYTLTAWILPGEGVNAAPYLGAEYCGGGVPHQAAAGVGGWFRRQGGGEYALDLRFTHPGPWAVAFMDRGRDVPRPGDAHGPAAGWGVASCAVPAALVPSVLDEVGPGALSV